MLSFVAHKHVLRVCTPTQQCRPQCLRPLQLRTARLQTHATHATDDDIDWAQLLSIEPTSVVVETPPVTPTQTRGAPLTTAQRRAHRTAAQQLDQRKRLVQINMGKNGSSDAFLQGVQDCLAANEYVKVKLSGGCMMELEEAKDLFIQACDATCVHTIGFTFILFRSKTDQGPPPVHVVRVQQQHEDIDDSIRQRTRQPKGVRQPQHTGLPAQVRVL